MAKKKTIDPRLIRVELFGSGRVTGVLGGVFGQSKAVADGILKSMFPDIKISRWKKVDDGWEYEGVLSEKSFAWMDAVSGIQQA